MIEVLAISAGVCSLVMPEFAAQCAEQAFLGVLVPLQQICLILFYFIIYFHLQLCHKFASLPSFTL
jgi:hypothetical protein